MSLSLLNDREKAAIERAIEEAVKRRTSEIEKDLRLAKARIFDLSRRVEHYKRILRRNGYKVGGPDNGQKDT